jgi:hypothetical protein
VAPDPLKVDSLIPRGWTEKVLRDLNHQTEWNRRMLEKGYTSAVLPVHPFHRRLRYALGRAIERRREAVALRIAPWLTPEDPDY